MVTTGKNDNYQVIDGITCYAPDLALSNIGFPSDALDKLYLLEENNFWYRSRNRVLVWLIGKFAKPESTFLEAGCGNGVVLKALSVISGIKLVGAEIYLSGLKHSKTRLPNVEFIQMDAEQIPFKNEFDSIGSFDVLEHIENDTSVLFQFFKALKKNGILVITVPQYAWLWSEIDVIDNHKRRYSVKELVKKTENAGFTIKYLNNFAFSVFPLMAVSRLLRRKNYHAPGLAARKNKDKHQTAYPELTIHPSLNYILGILMRIDEFLIKIGIHLPFGGSIILVAEKKGNF